MPPRASLQAFLAAAKDALGAPPAQRAAPLTLVVGNESADLDSLCSAIVYAYLCSHAPPHSLHVPLANLRRPELDLRPELAAVLARAGLGPADLPTLSDLCAAGHGLPSAPADARWVLVDHNALTGPLARFAPRVAACIDHHADERAVPADAAPRIVEPCGSCMSLVVEHARPAWDAFSAQDPRGDDALARLALAPILVDTANLTAADKVRDADTRAVGYLEARMQAQAQAHAPSQSQPHTQPHTQPQAPFDRAAYFAHLCAVKEDLSRLSLRDILRKDYKQWHESGLALGVSCVPQGLDYLVDRAAGPDPLLAHLAAWAAERALDVAAVMTTSHPRGQFQRHLLVWGRSPRGAAAVAAFARAACDPLRLQTWCGGELDDRAPAPPLPSSSAARENTSFAWSQGELAASRKQVAPLLREALRKVA